jgi:HlyD family secretion protein
MSLGDLSQLTITVYVPEDRYGQIRRGQRAIVDVDSFPGVTFDAEVTNISDHAEFTPRNVQTVEGRSATVYAVKLAVIDPEGRLKPGMPADVSFSE